MLSSDWQIWFCDLSSSYVQQLASIKEFVLQFERLQLSSDQKQ